MARLLHFVAGWSAPVCESHRSEVADAAQVLGAEVVEVDVDAQPGTTTAYNVLNVPAVAVEGLPESLVVGANPAQVLIERLGPFAA